MEVSRIPQASVFGRLVRLPLRLVPKNLVLPILRGPSKGTRWIVGSARHGYWLGEYETEKQHRFSEMLTDGDVVFDVGANVGIYSLLASRRVGPSGKVVALEPVPVNIGYLRKHLALNAARNVTVVEVAVTDELGSVNFSEGPSLAEGKVDPDKGDRQVKSITLDSLVLADGFPAPTLVKIDVEGGEVAVLRGTTEIIHKHKPRFFVAAHSEAIRTQCLSILQESGYRVEFLSTDDMELIAIPEY